MQDMQNWVRPADDIEAEWQAVARSITQEELAQLWELRRLVEAMGFDRHEACSVTPHSRRAGTLLRFLRARLGKIAAAAALLREALDWRQEYDIDRRLKEWRVEWADGCSARVRVLQKYDFMATVGKDREGLPVMLSRHSQADLGGLMREIGDEPLLLRMVSILEDCFAEAQAIMLKTGRFLCSFIEIADTGKYDLVPKYVNRGFGAISFYKKYQSVFEKVYPERIRVCFVVRAPAAFSVIWRLAQPMIPEATKHKIRFKGFASATWVEEMKELMPEQTVPAFLCSDDTELLHHAEPWGGIVPVGIGEL